MVKAATESASMEGEEDYEEGFDFEMSAPGGATEEESGIEGEGGEEIEGTTEEGGGEEI